MDDYLDDAEGNHGKAVLLAPTRRAIAASGLLLPSAEPRPPLTSSICSPASRLAKTGRRGGRADGQKTPRLVVTAIARAREGPSQAAQECCREV